MMRDAGFGSPIDAPRFQSFDFSRALQQSCDRVGIAAHDRIEWRFAIEIHARRAKPLLLVVGIERLVEDMKGSCDGSSAC